MVIDPGLPMQDRDTACPRHLIGVRALALAAAGAILLLGACTADRRGDDWEYRKDPSDNYGRIIRPAPDR